MDFFSEVEKLMIMYIWSHHIVNELNATEYYTLKWLIICYMSFTSIKHPYKKIPYKVTKIDQNDTRLLIRDHTNKKLNTV